MVNDQSNPQNTFQDLYEVVKTITFELKSMQEYQNINFTKTHRKMQERWFSNSSETQLYEINEQSVLDFGLKLVEFAEDFIRNLENGNVLKRALQIDKQLVEKCDRQLFHKLKKTNSIQVENPNTGKPYLKAVKFSDLNNLDLVCKMAKDEATYFLTSKLVKLANKLSFFGSKIKNDLGYKSNENTVHLYSGNAQFYANWRAFLSNLKDLLEILMLISKNPKAANLEIEASWNKTEESLDQLNLIKSKFVELENTLKSLDEKVNEEAKKPVIFTSLNSRSVNKDQSKIESEFKKVLELEKTINSLTTELSAINEQKFDVVEKLDKALKTNIDSLRILNDGNVLELFQKSSKGTVLDDEEYWKIKEFKFAKRILKYVKLSGVLVSSSGEFVKDRRNGKEEWVYNDILNYGKTNEKVAHNLHKINTHPNYDLFSKEYLDYRQFCDEKCKKSQELGNEKNLYNAINREVLRQKAMNYLSVLVKDSEFYYLVLIEKTFAKNNQIIEKLKVNQTENWEMLDYHKITFKALEKLALLDESTFDIDDQDLQSQAKEIWKIYKTKSFKELKNKGSIQNIKWYEVESRKRSIIDIDRRKLVTFCMNCLKKLPDYDKYNFDLRHPNSYSSIDEFAEDLDKQGYKSKWIGLNKDYLFELEKEDSENVFIFKLHNQDFRRDKIQDKTRKNNLFTKYWQDAMALGQEIRITPEIDIFKRNKEEIIVKKEGKKNKDETDTLSKPRNYQDKLYGAFKLQFYPKNNLLKNQNEQLDEMNSKTNVKNSAQNKTYYLGLDRGEKELVSFCLVDNTGQLIKNGDWTKFKDFDYADKLKKYKEKKQEIFHKYAEVSSCNDLELKPNLEKQAKDLQKQFEVESLLAAETIKKGYCSYLINEINQILIEYPNTYIVLEDLDMEGKANKETGENNKEQNLQKMMGGTVYQTIENAIINKFKYYVVKNNEHYEGLQFVPNITKVEDLRIKKDLQNEDNRGKIKWIKSKDQIGNILFVDEDLTSNECPNCGFIHQKVYKYRKFTKLEDIENEYNLSILEYKYTFSKQFYKEKLGTFLQKYCDNSQTLTEDEKLDFEKLFMPRAKKNGFMKHGDKDYFHCPSCGFSSTNCNSEKLKNVDFVVKTGDDVAAYNIAKRGLELISKVHKQRSNEHNNLTRDLK